MGPSEILGPDLAGVVADAHRAELPHVVIGGFAVIAHGYPRSTKDSDLLVPDGADADDAIARFLELAEARRLADDRKLIPTDIEAAHHLRLTTRHGAVTWSGWPP